MLSNNQKAFLSLVRAGLWEQEVRLATSEIIDLKEIYRLSQEQSVVGLVAAGIEQIKDVYFPKEEILTIVGDALQLEQQNIAMNAYVAKLFGQFENEGVFAVLVKGQGVAQCYQRPLWRSCGDIDLLLDNNNYIKAKEYLKANTDSEEEEVAERLHKGFHAGPWVVELHGTLRGRLYDKIDCELDAIQKDLFEHRKIREWNNDNIVIPLPSPDNDVIFIFTHILQHFSQSGIGLRQICDLCRLLWKCRTSINPHLLQERLNRMDLIKEWKSFGALMVQYLGLPVEAMPLYDESERYKKKASRVIRFVFDVGNMGHNRDTSYVHKYPYVVVKIISFFRESFDAVRHGFIFPKYAGRVWLMMVYDGVMSAIKGK